MARHLALDAAIKPTSFVDDVRFNGVHAYVTDAGVPSLIVLNLQTGAIRRVLDRHRALTADRPISAEGRILLGTDGRPVTIHADQLEVSPDGLTLFVQACSGPLYKIPTRFLDDTTVSASELSDAVIIMANTPSTGGTAIAADGTIYLSDTDAQRILIVRPDGVVSTLIEDPRLLWVDAMWIDSRARLWMPAAQLNRLAVFQGGVSKVTFPMCVYTVQLETGPAPNDHA